MKKILYVYPKDKNFKCSECNGKEYSVIGLVDKKIVVCKGCGEIQDTNNFTFEYVEEEN